MIEHPVPQNITAYQFHLIGNMTVKQFLMLLAGAGVGFLFYTTNLPGLIKWFFIIFFFGLSAVAAFVPYEDRTMDQWLINFIKAIYRPTKFYWRRHVQLPDFMSYQPTGTLVETPDASTWAPQKRQKVQAYLSSLQSGASMTEADPLDIFTRKSADVNELFTSVKAAANVTPGEDSVVDRPHLTVRTRPLRQPQEVFRAGSPGAVIAEAQAKTTQPSAPSKNAATHPATHTVSSVHQAPTTSPNSANQAGISPNEIRSSHSANTIKVANITTEAEAVADDNSATPTQTETREQSYIAADTLNSSSMSNGTILPVVFDRSLPFPTLPNEPNVLVGMVYDQQQKIVPNAIIEILDEKGNTVRAMKTNTLGQFYISSALKPGQYHLETESAGLTFPVYEITINNQVLDPVKIQATE